MIGVPSMIVTAGLPRPPCAGLDEWLRADKTVHSRRPPAAGPSGSRADVWPHKGGSPAECGPVAGQAGVRRREAARGQVGPRCAAGGGSPQRR